MTREGPGHFGDQVDFREPSRTTNRRPGRVLGQSVLHRQHVDARPDVERVRIRADAQEPPTRSTTNAEGGGARGRRIDGSKARKADAVQSQRSKDGSPQTHRGTDSERVSADPDAHGRGDVRGKPGL